MTDEELIAAVTRHWCHWSRHLGLDNYWLAVEMMEPGDVNEETAEITCTWHRDQYQRAYLHINPKLTDEFPLSLRILHECCHIKYKNLDDFAKASSPSSFQASWKEFIETECDDTAMIIWRLHAETGCKE